MREIILEKRYPHSREEDITDAFMRGYEQGKKDGLKVGKQIVLGAFETYITADRKTENSSEKPNNCEDLQDWKDRMWAEAIVTEPTISKMEQVDWKDQMWAEAVIASKTEPQTEKVETMSCQECKWWFTDSLKHGGYCQNLLYNQECRYEPQERSE